MHKKTQMNDAKRAVVHRVLALLSSGLLNKRNEENGHLFFFFTGCTW